MDYTQEVLDTLFNEKVNEFIQYQQHVCKRINNLCSELFPQKVVDIIDEYENTKHLFFTTEDLWFRSNKKYGIVEVEINPNKKKGISTTKIYESVIYTVIDSVKSLQNAIESFKDYELLLNLIETKAPQMIKDLVEWKKKQMRDSIEYLNNLDFSFPNNKTKHYIVTIKIEEVEE